MNKFAPLALLLVLAFCVSASNGRDAAAADGAVADPAGGPCARLFSETNWNLIAGGVYGNYIFYKTRMNAPNIAYFRAAARECSADLNASLQAGELDWREAALTRFKNLIAIVQVGLYEMNRYAAEYDFTDDALELVDSLRAAYASMREKDFFRESVAEFMRGFRKLEESGLIAETCAAATVIENYRGAGSTLQFEYVKTNNNLQHVLLNAASGGQSCAWSGDCLREAGGKIACKGSQGATGSFEARIDEKGLEILSQSLEAQCGFAPLSEKYERE